jgi:hypothetical protein
LAEILANGNTTGSTNIIVSASQSITTDTVSETTSAAGVTIDSVLVKDNTVTATTFTGDLTGDVTGDLTGNADTVTTNANLTGGVTSVGNAATVITNANLTGGVTSVGNAATVITNANLTGEVTSVGNAATIADDVVDEANLKSDNAPTNDYVLTAKSSASGGLTWASPTVGDITGVTAGTNLSGGGTSGTVTLNLDNPVVANLTGNASGSAGSCTGNSATVTNGVYTTNNLSVLAATTSAQLAGVISDETGSGSLVFATSPTLVTPALGTPASGVATNLTGTAASLTAGTVTTNANLTGGVTSVGNAATVITNANLTGDVTSSGNATTIATDAVDIAMLSATGTASSSTFLRGDNAWSTPVGSGDVSKVGTPVDSQVGVWTGDGTIEGTTSLVFDSTGLGIATAAPTSLLDVRGPTGTGTASAGVLTLATNELTIVDNDQLGRIEFRSPIATAGTDAIVSAAAIWAEANATFSASVNSADIVFATATSGAASERMRITSTGVGIGPVARDSVPLFVERNVADYATSLAETVSRSTLSLKTHSSDSAVTTSGGVGVAGAAYIQRSNGPGTASYDLVLNPFGSSVGIGLTVPSEKLDVNGTIQCLNELRSTSGNDLKLNAGSASRDVFLQVNDVTMMTVQGSTGRIGIGTQVPGYKLEVTEGTANEIMRLDGANSGTLTFRNSTANEFVLYTGTSDALIFGTGGNNERMRITNTGLVGIGVAAPAAKLDVAGQILGVGGAASAPTFSFSGDTNTGISRPTADAVNIVTGGTERLRVNSTGVGIGTQVPTVELDVSGSISLQSDNNLTWGNAAYAAGVPTISGKTDSGFYFHPDGSTSGVTLRILADGRVTVKKASNSEITPLTDASTIAIDFDDANNFSLLTTSSIGASRVLGTPSNITAGQSGCIVITSDAASRALTYTSAWHFEGGTDPALTTDSGGVDTLVYYCPTAFVVQAVLLKDLK